MNADWHSLAQPEASWHKPLEAAGTVLLLPLSSHIMRGSPVHVIAQGLQQCKLHSVCVLPCVSRQPVNHV